MFVKSFILSLLLVNSSFGFEKSGLRGDRVNNASCNAYPIQKDGSIYIMTNEPHNEILLYSRSESSGRLVFKGSFSTNGSGGQLSGGPLPAPTDDPLGSQDSIIVAGSCLLAANAGSNDISSFRIIDSESIEFVEKVPSGGNYPVSLTHRDGLVYSLNAGLDGDKGNPGSIQGFHLLGYSCRLEAIGDSIPLGQSTSSGDAVATIFPASPAQIGFSPEGNIILTIKSNGGNNEFPSQGSINVYSIDKETGMIGGLTQTFVEGSIPFSFDFDKDGNFLLVEAFGSSTVGSPNAGRVTMYKNIDSTPSLIQAGDTSQTTSCWIRYNTKNSCAYTTNNGGSSITSFRVTDGCLELVEKEAASLDVPIDFSFSPDQEFLYAVATGHVSGDPEASQPAIYVYKINCNCRLTKVQRVIDGIPNEADREINANGVANGIVGLAVY